jgi:hypothetical protein
MSLRPSVGVEIFGIAVAIGLLWLGISLLLLQVLSWLG